MTVPVCVVCASAVTVGVEDKLLQQTPHAVMGDLPSLVTVPPPVAAFLLMSAIGEVVVTVGGDEPKGWVVKLTVPPYEVPKELVA